jgi:hypothetical protein
MPNYVNTLVDPAGVAKNSFNNMLNMYQLKETRKRNKLMEAQNTREQEKFDIEMKLFPFRFVQLKENNIRDIAKNISGMPTDERARKYADMIKVAQTPITEHPGLGPLGVIDPKNFLSQDEFVKMDDKQQKQYLALISYTADDVAKLNLSDKELAAKADEIMLRHDNRLQEIKAQKAADIDLERFKQEGKGANKLQEIKAQKAADIELERVKQEGKGATDEKTKQNRIDKYHKEIAGLASVRERIRKGDDLYKLGQMMSAISGKKKLAIEKDSSIESALAKVDEYEAWLRERLRKLEGGEDGGSDDPFEVMPGKNTRENRWSTFR